MISKQKLLQWVKDHQDIYGPPYQDEEEINRFKSALVVLDILRRDINAGEFVVDNGEEVKG